MAQVVKVNTAQALGQAVGTIVISRFLLLEGIKVLRRPLPKGVKESDTAATLLRELEAEVYFLSAGACMAATFGLKGKVRRIADKCLKNMREKDINAKKEVKDGI
jgi:hypothetical protein